MPIARMGAITRDDIIAVFEDELSELPEHIYSKYTKAEGIVESLHRSISEEQLAKKVLNNYMSSLKTTTDNQQAKYKKLIKLMS